MSGSDYFVEFRSVIRVRYIYTADFSCVRKSRIAWTFTQVLKSLFLLTETILACSCSRAKEVDV